MSPNLSVNVNYIDKLIIWISETPSEGKSIHLTILGKYTCMFKENHFAITQQSSNSDTPLKKKKKRVKVGTRQLVHCLFVPRPAWLLGMGSLANWSRVLVDGNISHTRNSSLEKKKRSKKYNKNDILYSFYKVMQYSDISQRFIIVSPAYTQNSLL